MSTSGVFDVMRSFLSLLIALLVCPTVWGDARLPAIARKQIGVTVEYDGSYERIPYPGGDVPISRGVCTDVVIRALRALGLDLQKEVHEDMKSHFSPTPKIGDSNDRIRILTIAVCRICAPFSRAVVGHCPSLIILRIICPAT